jgi:hypothetical protein
VAGDWDHLQSVAICQVVIQPQPNAAIGTQSTHLGVGDAERFQGMFGCRLALKGITQRPVAQRGALWHSQQRVEFFRQEKPGQGQRW